MTSSLIANTLQVDFESVPRFPEESMAAMFKALQSSGLRGFLGCSSGIYEADLVAFFQNALVRENSVVSTIQGKLVEITEEQFSGILEFPTEGLSNLFEVSKDLIFDARSIFSKSGEQVLTSCKKRKMKYEFRLLNDILVKSVTVKTGSFDAVTHEWFLLMTAIHCGLKINWMTHEWFLLMTAIHCGLKINWSAQCQNCWHVSCQKKGIDDGNEGDEPVMAAAEVVTNKPVTKKRTAPITAEPVAKKKRTTVERPAPVKKDLAMVPVVQNPEPIYVVPAATPKAQRRCAPKRKLVMQQGSDDEIVDSTIHQKHSIVVNDEDDNLDGAENEISRKMRSSTAPEQFLKDPLRSAEDNNMSGFKQPSKINETEEPDVVEPVAVEITVTTAVEIEEEKETDKEKEIEPVPLEQFCRVIVGVESVQQW
ncbi:splicing factor 3B subunit 1-like [Dorcoceras hygrometricum]|uniref:Splicing factor 3B subunit 1-like n=1 Tax=Dorcoceras hygrometricum TaxID=472368 RepID=A0A2Z7CYI6_9LAMI|nr:splicing factor 3B subunit 1-like [Dorcoceras hygrometricum]